MELSNDEATETAFYDVNMKFSQFSLFALKQNQRQKKYILEHTYALFPPETQTLSKAIKR